MARCPTCDFDNAEGARFCSNCGTTLAARVATEERRTVTVLFADLVGSTSMGERLDPEVTRDLVGRFFEAAAEEARRHSGTVEKFAGDAVLALFGLNVSHEDDPERAVRAALAIRDRAGALALEAHERHGVSLEVRIGIETGEAVVGDPFGGSTMATGDVVNIAARLEQAAEPGEIVVGPTAHAATRSAVEYEPRGAQKVRGRDSSLETWRAVGASAELGGVRGIAGLSAPLTGRDQELDLLLHALDRVAAERKPVLFTLVGPPGIGKSRLVLEFATRAAATGTTIVRGRCLPYGEGITYWPMAEMVRRIAGIEPGLSNEAAVALLTAAAPEPLVAERLALAIGLNTDAGQAGQSVDREIAWAFRRLVESAAARGPLVLVFEDIHWAEPALLDLIEYLATWTRDASLLIVCPARPELLDRRPAWGSGRMESSRIVLDPLDQAESAALLGALLDIDDLPHALRERVLERAEGNPLFVEEVVRMLVDRGLVVRRDDRWVATDEATDVAVPESVEAIIRARLDTLPRPGRALLQAASVVGRTFERSAVAVLVDDGEPLEPRIEDAMLRDLVTEEPTSEPSYRFKHILVRDVAYASLPKATRADLHVRVVEWLDAWAGDRGDEVLDIRAYHLEQAVSLRAELEGRVGPELAETAIAALDNSATKAIEREDFRAGEGFATRAIDLAHAAGIEPPLEVRWRQVEAAWRRNDQVLAAALARPLADEARLAGRSDIEGRAILAFAEQAWLGVGTGQGVEAGRRELDRAFTLLDREEDLPYRFEAAFSLGFVGWWYGDLERAFDDWTKAEEIAVRMGDAGAASRVLSRQASIRSNQGRMDESKALRERCLELAEASGSRVAKTEAVVGLGYFLMATTSMTAASERFAEAAVLSEELGDQIELAICLAALGEVSILAGEPADGVAPLERAVALFEAVGHAGILPEAQRVLATAYLDMGDIEKAEQLVLRAVEVTAADDWATVASTRMVLGNVRAAQGRDEEAERLLRDAVEVIDKTGFATEAAWCHAALGSFLVSRGRRPAEGEEWLGRARQRFTLLSPESPYLAVLDRQVTAARARAADRAASVSPRSPGTTTG